MSFVIFNNRLLLLLLLAQNICAPAMICTSHIDKDSSHLIFPPLFHQLRIPITPKSLMIYTAYRHQELIQQRKKRFLIKPWGNFEKRKCLKIDTCKLLFYHIYQRKIQPEKKNDLSSLYIYILYIKMIS